MQWHKKGRIYSPDGSLWWNQTHCFVPTPLVLKDKVRIFFSGWGKNKTGRIGYLDVNPLNPSEILGVSPEPVLDVGDRGCFDESGVTPSSIYCENGKIYLYYIGWQNLQSEARYLLFSGLAVGGENVLPLTRYTKTPLLDRTNEDSCTRTGPFALPENNRVRTWYVGGSGYIKINDRFVPEYAIKHVVLQDGKEMTTPLTCISPNKSKGEFGLSRPWVVFENGCYKMWYAIRYLKDGGYLNLGYAESMDGIKWSRKDNEVGIKRSLSGWDSEMICFPAVVTVGKKKYMFYNGNNYGESGLGYAEME